MCAAPSAAASLGGPLPSPSCSASLPFCSLFKLPHHFCRIFTHSHAVTHALAHASTHPACLGVAYISLPISATSAEHSYRLSLTHSRSCTCSHYTHTRAHTHTHTHTLTHIHTHTHTHACAHLCSTSLVTWQSLGFTVDFPGGTVVKNLPANAGDTKGTGLIPGSGRSPG